MKTTMLGLVEYSKAQLVQERAASSLLAGHDDGVLLVLRHPPTITLGRRTEEREVHVDPADAARLGISVHRTNRGGGATYHYPGQAVLYAVLHLGRLGLTVGGLIDLLGRCAVDVLRGHGIDATWDTDRPGAYVGDAKIASIGLHVSRDVSTHGLAVNVGPDTRGFELIDPCKMPGLAVTSMAEYLAEAPGPDEVGSALAEAVSNLLAMRRESRRHRI